MFEKGERGLTELIVGVGKWKCVVKERDPYATRKAYPDVEVIVVVVIAAGGQAVDLLHYVSHKSSIIDGNRDNL